VVEDDERDDSRAAILEAAASLLSERGPASVSIRDVADRAGLQRDRVHAHFPTKHDLLGAVLQAKADEVARELARQAGSGDQLGGLLGPAQFIFESAAQSDFWRILARAVLDRADPQRLQVSFPAVELLIERVEGLKAEGFFDPDVDARVLVGGWVSASLGWLVFGDHLAAALGYGLDNSDQARRIVLSMTLANLAYAAAPRNR
jgi:AcrR family transcriptional regulator